MRSHLLPGVLRSFAAITFCGVALSTVPVLAQDAPPPPPAQDSQGPPQHEGRPDPAQMQARRLEMMTKRLNLTPDQVTQIKAIDGDTLNQMQALRGDSSTSREDKRAKMQSIHQASNDKIRAVLNDEQKTKYDAMEAHRREHGHEHGNGGPPPPPPTQQ